MVFVICEALVEEESIARYLLQKCVISLCRCELETLFLLWTKEGSVSINTSLEMVHHIDVLSILDRKSKKGLDQSSLHVRSSLP